MALVAAVLLLATGQTLPANAAPDDAKITITKDVAGWAPGATVAPGQSFAYRLEVTCNNSNFGGCNDAFLLDPIPAGLLLDGDASAVTVVGDGVKTKVSIEAPQTVRLDVVNDLGGGLIGMGDGKTITVTIPVRVDPDLSPSETASPSSTPRPPTRATRPRSSRPSP